MNILSHKKFHCSRSNVPKLIFVKDAILNISLGISPEKLLPSIDYSKRFQTVFLNKNDMDWGHAQKYYKKNLHSDRTLSIWSLFAESISNSCLGRVPLRLLFPITKKGSNYYETIRCACVKWRISAYPYNPHTDI